MNWIKKNWKMVAVTAVIGIVAVYAWNTYVNPIIVKKTGKDFEA
jgi:hypothetical protein